ncbi:MAG: S9 family peptidase [Gemmatimonadota bacterium]|nr:MAG: S9 family peptidase [Gemmatimonadota bacterium]
MGARTSVRKVTPAVFALLVALAAQAQAQVGYPQTRKIDHVDNYHGTIVPDPYRWLEDVDSDETKAWVELQNEVTFAYLASIPERAWIRERLTELWNYERYSAPWKDGGCYFFSKNDGLQNQPVYYMQETLDSEPVVILDPNKLSEDGTVFADLSDITEDGRLMVYSVATSGSDWRELFVRDLETGADLDDHLRWIKFGGASWTHDGVGFFYNRYPEPVAGDAYEAMNRNQKIYYHRVGTRQSEDQLIYERPDQPDWGFGGYVTDDGRYVIMSVWASSSGDNAVFYKDLGDPLSPRLDAEVVELLPEFEANYDFVDNDGTTFYFLTNLDAPKYRLIAVDAANPAPENWKTIIPEKDDVLESVRIVNNQFVARYMHDAQTQISIYALDGTFDKELELPTLGSVRRFSGEREDSEAFYEFSSFLYPSTIFRYDFETGESTVLRAPNVDFDASGYETRQVFYTSRDGTSVPMFLTYKKGIALDGTNPTYLYGYGGFNSSRRPNFSTSILVWLEMGGVYASANLRGGGEYGEEWHLAGTKERKQNVFDDFVAAAEYLIDEGYTQPSKLAIAGASNGGLLVGAVMVQRPELFGATLPAVGVMDMLRFHEFTIGWAWTSDYGSSDDAEGFRYLYAYSPYHNLHPHDYPATMVTTSDHDDRVVPGHSFKFAARLQEMQMGEAPVLIRIQTKAGHGSGKPTAMIIEEQADRWAFLVKNLGIRLGEDAAN